MDLRCQSNQWKKADNPKDRADSYDNPKKVCTFNGIKYLPSVSLPCVTYDCGEKHDQSGGLWFHLRRVLMVLKDHNLRWTLQLVLVPKKTSASLPMTSIS